MSILIKVAGSWVETAALAKTGGVIVTASDVLLKIQGVWVSLYDSNFSQIGDIIITGESILYTFNNTPKYDLLLCDGSTFNELIYSELYAILGGNILPNIPDEIGSPFPYKIVADYTGV